MLKGEYFDFLDKRVAVVGSVAIATVFCSAGLCFGFFFGMSVESVRSTSVAELAIATIPAEVTAMIATEKEPAATDTSLPTATAAEVTAVIETEIPQTDEPSISETPAETLEPHAAFEMAVEKELGEGNREVSRIAELEFDKPNEGAIFIKWAINDNLTENFIKYGAKMDVVRILKALADSQIDYTYITLSGTFSLVDQFGNSEEKNVVYLVFNKSTVDRINWDNFLTDNIYKIADQTNIHVLFRDN